ncbi:hypothetical protein CDAR_182931 [Caerostris darwini]|uniref:Uncharacterized protein n=1 Tax=Caerostris darwini TaxID=1538125 RepID=A0AAV4T9L3_9ARAC|nr:hypothetical protein CDAR_182931 [Caerostris darwini]
MMDERNDRLLLHKPSTDDTGIGMRPWEEAPPSIETLWDLCYATFCLAFSNKTPREKYRLHLVLTHRGCPGKSRRLYKDILGISESPENSETVAAKLFVNITGVVGFLILPPPPSLSLPSLDGAPLFYYKVYPTPPLPWRGRKFQSEKHVIWGMRAEALRFSSQLPVRLRLRRIVCWQTI